MKSLKQSKFSLGLDPDDEDNEQPRRLLLMPCGSWLAYGGEDGYITGKPADRNSNSNSNNDAGFSILQRYDDGVRAVAVSADGKRLAVGFDNGATRIYKFDDFNANDKSAIHPFCQSKKKSQGGGGNGEDDDDDEDDDDMLMSQDFTANHADVFAGPQVDLPIRDLTFVEETTTSTGVDGNKGDVHDTSYWLAVASESGLFMVDVSSSDTLSQRYLEQEVKEHHDQCGIRGVDVTTTQAGDEGEKTTMISSLAMDGRLCLWKWQPQGSEGSRTSENDVRVTLLRHETTSCIPKKDVGEVHGADAYDRSCRPIFYEEYLATPGQLLPVIRKLKFQKHGTQVIQLLVENNVETHKREEGRHVEPIVCLAFLSSTELVSGGRDGRLILWKFQVDEDNDTLQLKPLESIRLTSPPTDIVRFRGRNTDVPTKEINVVCANGEGVRVDFTPRSQPDPRVQQTVATNSTHPRTGTGTEASDRNQGDSGSNRNRVNQNNNNDDNDGDDDDDLNFGKNKSVSKSVRFIDDEAEDTQVIGQEMSTLPPDDSGMGDSRYNDHDTLLDDYGDVDEDIMPNSNQQLMLPGPPKPLLVPPQPAFSPSSTPLDLTRRFLCWNHIGSVTSLQTDDGTGRNMVDIQFTDSAFKRPISFTDTQNFIVGSLGEDGGIFASDLQEDDEDNDEDVEGLEDLAMSDRTKMAVKKSRRKRKPNARPTGSSIFFYRFETFGNPKDKDWYISLPDGERALGTACGVGWGAVMTSRRFLRLFSSGGNQCQMVWLPGQPVTMAGRSRFLAVVYHRGNPLVDGTQQLGYTLWDVTSFHVISEGSLSCISKGSSLTWMGFSNDYSLMALDSDGMLSMLVACGRGGSRWGWSPVLDTVGIRKSSEDQFWPVNVHDGKLVCVPLKGGNTYPDATRRPVTTTLNLRIPLAKSSIPRSTAFEELSVRSNIALAQKKIVNDLSIDSDNAGTAEDFEREYLTMSAQVDKVTLKLFAATLDAGKLERCLDLVDRLHLEKSYDLAVKLADRHHKLADLIEAAKEDRFGNDVDQDEDGVESDDDGDENGYDDSEETYGRSGQRSHGQYMPSRMVSPDGLALRSRPKRQRIV